MRRGPQPQPITRTDAEREKLDAWSCRPTTQPRLAIRARIVLAAAIGPSHTAIAAELRITRPTVRKWRGRFADARRDGLTDEPRPGATRTVTDAQVEQALARTLETTPKDATHGSTRTLAHERNLSPTAVSRIWRAFGLKPHRRETFNLRTDDRGWVVGFAGANRLAADQVPDYHELSKAHLRATGDAETAPNG